MVQYDLILIRECRASLSATALCSYLVRFSARFLPLQSLRSDYCFFRLVLTVLLVVAVISDATSVATTTFYYNYRYSLWPAVYRTVFVVGRYVVSVDAREGSASAGIQEVDTSHAFASLQGAAFCVMYQTKVRNSTVTARGNSLLLRDDIIVRENTFTERKRSLALTRFV